MVKIWPVYIKFFSDWITSWRWKTVWLTHMFSFVFTLQFRENRIIIWFRNNTVLFLKECNRKNIPFQFCLWMTLAYHAYIIEISYSDSLWKCLAMSHQYSVIWYSTVMIETPKKRLTKISYPLRNIGYWISNYWD